MAGELLDSQSSVKGSHAPDHSVIHPPNLSTLIEPSLKKEMKLKSFFFGYQIVSRSANLGRSHALMSSFLMHLGNIVKQS